MSCALTQGYAIDCMESMGGLDSVYLIAKQDVESILEAEGVVTSIVKSTGKRFWKYECAKGTAFFNEPIQSNVANGTIHFAPELTIVLNKLQANTRNEVLLLAKNNLVAVAKDNNGKYWLLGKQRGLNVTGGSANSGTAVGDRSGYTINLTGQEPELSPEVGEGVVSSLEVAGS